MNVFNEIDKFFSSLKNFLEMNEIFFIFVGLFLFTIFVVIISTSRAYEARLIKAIDMFNSYFVDNPQITEDNLVPFNNKMKSRKVPKQLRKQWQQFVLYREKKASEYMSFESCVSIPIKNSTYKRDISIMNSVSWILAIVCFVVNLYMVLSDDVAVILGQAFMTPAIIILLNIIVRIFLDLRHNAIVSDLHSNYQYFEVNIDKATETLPEYVDYEVLFDKNEIKRGIPMLYAYLQKRAEMEKKELERARLKNVHHEKFNFDEAGVESSLVLERAMQEAENYIAERKKLMQDIEQINADITQEEMNFRETTKEYQRQMQVSKETFDNFKAQLEEATSTIEINYLKKQQQQELDRQRNLERDYDTATDRHKKVLSSYQEELISVENEIKKARNTLERGMLSEFDTYSGKVYDEAMRVVEEREADKVRKLKANIKELEEKLIAKDNEIESIYNQNQNLNSQLANQVNEYKQRLDEQDQILTRVSEEVGRTKKTTQTQDYSVTSMDDGNDTYEYVDNSQETYDYIDDSYNYVKDSESTDTFNYLDIPQETFDYTSTASIDDAKESVDFDEKDFDFVDESDEDNGEEIKVDLDETKQGGNLVASKNIFTKPEDESKPKKKAGRPRKVVTDEKPKKGPGRPRKVVEENKASEPKKGPGRPRKVEPEVKEPKKGPGRPRKVEEVKVAETEPKRGPGRPRKEAVKEVAQVENGQVKRRGRPKKVETLEVEPVRKPGRPKKTEITELEAEPKKKVGRPKKVVDEVKVEEPKRRGRPKKVETEVAAKPIKKGRGRPRKEQVEDIDAYLKELDDEIAKESAKIAETEKALAKNTTIKKRK